jgi:outer membrane immunogenic protein
MMREFAVAACLIAVAPGAYAADLGAGSTKDFGMQPPAVWTGFYTGVTVGGASNHLKMAGEGYDPVYGGYATLEGDFLTDPSARNTSFVGTVEAGYNWQHGDYVIGAVIDFGRLNAKHSSGTAYMQDSDVVPDTDTASLAADWFGTVRARLGYAAGSNLLIYGTGGVAAVRLTGGFVDTDAVAGDTTSDTSWALGWAAGAGADYRISQNWFIRGEYLHVSASTKLVTYVVDENEAYSVKSTFDSDMFKAGLFYKF